MRATDRCPECGTRYGYTARFKRKLLGAWLAVVLVTGIAIGLAFGRWRR